MPKEKIPSIVAPIGGGTGITSDGRLVTGVTGRGRALSLSDGRVAMPERRTGGATQAAWWAMQQGGKTEGGRPLQSGIINAQIHTFAQPYRPEFYSPFLPNLVSRSPNDDFMVEGNGRATKYADFMKSVTSPDEENGAFFELETLTQEGVSEMADGTINVSISPQIRYECTFHFKSSNELDWPIREDFLIWYHLRTIAKRDWLIFAVRPFFATLTPFREIRFAMNDLSMGVPERITVTCSAAVSDSAIGEQSFDVPLQDGRDIDYYQNKPHTWETCPTFVGLTIGRNTIIATIDFDAPSIDVDAQK